VLGKNGIGGGSEGFTGVNRESTAHRDQGMTVLSSLSWRLNSVPQVAAFSLQLQLIVPALLSHIPLSWHRQLGLLRRVILHLYIEIIVPNFHVFCRSASGWWLVSGISGKSQYSIVLLTIEKVRPLVVDDMQHWVSLGGHVRGWLVWLFVVLGCPFPCPNSKSSS